jgi:hypothetical protein
MVKEKVKELYPGMVPRNLPTATEKGRFLIPTPPIIRSLLPLHPPYLVARFDRIVKENVNERLMSAWDELMKLGIRFPDPDGNRSSTPALHLGVWELYGTNPRLTSDTVRFSNDAIVAMDRFLQIIREAISPKLHNILAKYYPRQFDRQMR